MVSISMAPWTSSSISGAAAEFWADTPGGARSECGTLERSRTCWDEGERGEGTKFKSSLGKKKKKKRTPTHPISKVLASHNHFKT